MNAERSTTKTIAVIGGGVSGALTAYHLSLQQVNAQVIVIEPRLDLGLGLAYSTPSLRHLLNVPAGNISALPEQPQHFLDWLRQNIDAQATPATFAPRAVFGRYIRSLLAEITQIQNSVTQFERCGEGAILTLADGARMWADFVVLATGNFDPAALPGIEPDVIENGLYCHNAWLPQTYTGLEANASVTLIGSGLTAVDVLLRLRELGHCGVITAVSRHGALPTRHAPFMSASTSAIPKNTPATCCAYLRALRASIAAGVDWRAAIDSLRASINDLWLALPLHEQKRFRRHLQRRWDVVRHRMAPPIADLIAAELAAGTLVVREGHLAAVAAAEEQAVVTIETAEGHESIITARVINCTGPNMNYRRVKAPLLQSLFTQGIATAGPLGGGVNTTRSGALIDADGLASPMLFNLGPGRLGTLLESIAIPEIRQQAVELAAILTEKLGLDRGSVPEPALLEQDVVAAVAA